MDLLDRGGTGVIEALGSGGGGWRGGGGKCESKVVRKLMPCIEARLGASGLIREDEGLRASGSG